MYDVIVVGGGLSGLISSILLKKNGFNVLLIEKNTYPFHRVCGEYISNEVIPFLKSHDLYPSQAGPRDIRHFILSDIHGNKVQLPLDQGGFGISRYRLDKFLFDKACDVGVKCLEGTRVEEIHFRDNRFEVITQGQSFEAGLVIGAFGKRSHLDKQLNRSFMKKRSPFIGVKYHFTGTPQSLDTIGLHNFRGGYCGVNAVEDGFFNICYLSHRDNIKKHGSIKSMEENVLFKNPLIQDIFLQSQNEWENPLVINEISFETKEPVINHILTCGDAAGMITPLCGNGMAMAIHSAKLMSESISKHFKNGHPERSLLELEYSRIWKEHFSFRLSSGRQIQKLFGSPVMSGLAVNIAKYMPGMAQYIMSKTHGRPF